MATKRQRGARDYLFKRKGTKHWWVKFQYPEALRGSACDLYGCETWPKEKSWSLQTPDDLVARSRALPAIQAHTQLLLYHAARTDPDNHWGDLTVAWLMEPNTREVKPDGTIVAATRETIVTIAPDGEVSEQQNRQEFRVDLTEHALNSPQGRGFMDATKRREQAAHKDVDLEALNTYCSYAKLEADDEALAKRALDAFRLVNGGLPIAQSSRKHAQSVISVLCIKPIMKDGQIDHERDPLAKIKAQVKQCSVSRAKKAIAYLRAAVNHDRKDAANTRYQYNIFDKLDWPSPKSADVVQSTRDKAVSLSEADLRIIRDNRHEFTDEEWLMLVFHCSTSVRPKGIFGIKSCEWEEEDEHDNRGEVVQSHRTRYVHIESDKAVEGDYGDRYLPIPQKVLDARKLDGSPLLPDEIKGSLFTGADLVDRDKRANALSNLLLSINKKLKKIGVATDTNRKTLYSGRHRAKDQISRRKIDDRMARTIMGHARDRSDAHSLYGDGFMMYEIKPEIDKIGF